MSAEEFQWLWDAFDGLGSLPALQAHFDAQWAQQMEEIKAELLDPESGWGEPGRGAGLAAIEAGTFEQWADGIWG